MGLTIFFHVSKVDISEVVISKVRKDWGLGTRLAMELVSSPRPHPQAARATVQKLLGLRSCGPRELEREPFHHVLLLCLACCGDSWDFVFIFIKNKVCLFSSDGFGN